MKLKLISPGIKMSQRMKSVFILALLIITNHINSQITFEDGFESGNYSKWKEHIEGAGSKIEMCNTRARSGKYSVRFTTDNSRRAELVGEPNIEFYWGNEHWIGFSFYSKVPAGGAKIIYQHHSTPGDRDWSCKANPNSFTIKNHGEENIRFLTSTDESRLNEVPTEGGATKYTDEWIYPAQINSWHDIVMNFRYNPDSTGFLKVWSDGELVLDHKGMNVYLKDGCGELRDPRQYMKIGLYPAGSGADGEIYYDEIRVGDSTASYDLVKPRGEIREYKVHAGDGKEDEKITLGNKIYAIDWAFRDDFDDSEFETYWQAETTRANIVEKDSFLNIADSTSSEGTTLWLKDDLASNDLIILAKAKSISGAANLNLMSNTREADHKELNVGLRDGNYEDYHYGIGENNSTTPATKGYIATFTEDHSRIRKNPGFSLLTENLDKKGETDIWYDITWIINNGTLRYFINDELIHEYTDTSPLWNGKLGIRSWHTNSVWDYLYVGEILSESDPGASYNGGLPVIKITASGDDGNIPENTWDNNLNSRWSAEGDGQWIIHELDSVYLIGSVDIAFHKGTERITFFDLSISEDGADWILVYNGNSSGLTTDFEHFGFDPVEGKYVKLTGHKNSENDWNSITEIRTNEGEIIIGRENIPQTKMRIDPNPLADIAFIKLPFPSSDQFALTITSVDGRVVFRRDISITQGKGVADMQELKRGTYLCELANEVRNYRNLVYKL